MSEIFKLMQGLCMSLTKVFKLRVCKLFNLSNINFYFLLRTHNMSPYNLKGALALSIISIQKELFN